MNYLALSPKSADIPKFKNDSLSGYTLERDWLVEFHYGGGLFVLTLNEGDALSRESLLAV
ncbi:MAG: hypothetical protein IPN42_04655 [Methylococcaceae bacterium]|nr:hypothetical protein [Methylococcaceae bacterium]